MMTTLATPIRRATVVLSLALSALGAPSFSQDVRFRDGRFFETQGGVTLQRADEASSDEAVRNMPFLPGDRVWTDDAGRAEIVFANGEVLWIAERSKVDSLGRGGSEQDERLGLRVFAGSFGVRVRGGGPGFEFRAPGGTLTTTGAAAFRVDVRAGETTLSVSEGEVLANLAGERLAIRAGERVRYADQKVEGPFGYQRASVDAFDRWCEDRMAELTRLARNRDDERLPDELDAYAGELEQNGEWVYDEPSGYVYVPRVAYDWAPYTYGRWVYTLYGWTWVAEEPWGFVTSHYGRWGYSSRIGWHWMPRAGFAGAWVGWSTPVGRFASTIGWCALGFNDRPVSSFLSGGVGRAASRGEAAGSSGRGWSFTNRSDMGRANVHRRRVDVPAEEAQRAVVWSPGTTPNREFREARIAVERQGGGRSGEGSGSGARIYVRPSPGDTTPELRSDPTTTIPSPESRRGRTIGQDGFKDDQNNRRNRTRFEGATLSIDEGTSPPPSAETTRPRQPEQGGRAPRPPAGATQTSPAGEETPRAEGNRESAQRDPLLSRFFRSITSPNPDRESARDRNRDRETDSNRSDSGATRRRDPAPRDEPSAREASPRERPRSEDSGRERSRPGAERSQPRNSPPPAASPRGGGSNDDRGSRRRQQPGL